MLARIRKAAQDKDGGFTLIELLVVMIIIGILAAIAIPVFLNQRKKAVDTSIKSDLRTVATQMETYFTDNQAYVAVATNAAATPKVMVGTTDVTLSANNVVVTKLVKQSGASVALATGPADATGFCLSGTNTKSSGGIITYNSLAGGLSQTACP